MGTAQRCGVLPCVVWSCSNLSNLDGSVLYLFHRDWNLWFWIWTLSFSNVYIVRFSILSQFLFPSWLYLKNIYYYSPFPWSNWMNTAFLPFHKLEIFFSSLLSVAVPFITFCWGEKMFWIFHLQIIYCRLFCFIVFSLSFQYGNGKN